MKTQNHTYAVATMYNSEIESWAAPVTEAKRRWCNTHAMPMHVSRPEELHGRHVVWMKLLAIFQAINLFPQASWIFWSDADSIITTPGKSLSMIVPPQIPDSVVVIGSKDHNGFNAGNFLLRSCSVSETLLFRIYKQTEYIDHPMREQAAMAYVLNGMPGALQLLPKRTINAYPDDWQPGDLLCHLAGRPRTLPIVESWMEKGAPATDSIFIP